jgi:aldehyde:ferredoxin oxidoreductase
LDGSTGTILKVDLRKGTVVKENPGEPFYRKWFGAYGVGARIVYDDTRPGIKPLGQDNVLGMTTGVLTGTPVLFSGSFTAVGKSPLTGYWGEARAGGFFGRELKQAGYDDIFFYGRASKPTYVTIKDSEVALHSAGDLWGLNVKDTEKTLKEKSGDKGTQVASIGRAGEKLSLISGIMTDEGRAAGRSGLGAVMGSKNLKAVAVLGTGKPGVHDADKLKELNKKVLDASAQNPMFNYFSTYGTTSLTSSSIVQADTGVKNWGGSWEADFPQGKEAFDPSVIHKYDYKKYACSGCPLGCGSLSRVESGPYACETHRAEYESQGAFGPLLLNDNIESIIYLSYLCNDYGLDTISVGGALAYAIECYENGLITKKDTDGVELKWGNTEAIVEMAKKMAERTSHLGALLADGVRVASTKIKGSSKYAMHVGGQEIPQHDPRLVGPYNSACLFMYVADATPARHTQSLAAFAGAGMAIGFAFQALGLCSFGSIMGSLALAHDFANAVTGWDVTPEELLTTANRVVTMRQAFNIREGWKPSDYVYPDRMLGKPPLTSGPLKGVTIDPTPKVEEYWKGLGWDPRTGKPLSETLEELGLQDVQRDLYR